MKKMNNNNNNNNNPIYKSNIVKKPNINIVI